MKKQIVFFTHSVAACALFILGDAVIIMPQNAANKFTFLGFLISFVSGLALIAITAPFLNRIFLADTATHRITKKIILAIIYSLTALFALWCAGCTFKNFSAFANEVMLGEISKALAIIIFCAVVLYFSLHRQENILKFCLLAFWLVVAVAVFFFLACITRYNFRNAFIFNIPSYKELISQTKPYILNPLIPSLILPVYNSLVFKNKSSRAVLTGLTVGFAVLGICILNSILLFGTEFAGELAFPFSSAVSTVTVGRLFTRLDEFSYFVYFITSLIKITVSIYVLKSCLKKTNNILKGEKKNEKK